MRRRLTALLFTAFLSAPLFARSPAPKTEYSQRVERELDQVATRLRSMATNAGDLSGEERERFDRALRMLWQKERSVRVRLQAFRTAPSAQRPKIRKQTDTELIRLRKSIQYVVNHYPVQK